MAVCSEGSAVCTLPASKLQQVSRSLQTPGILQPRRFGLLALPWTALPAAK